MLKNEVLIDAKTDLHAGIGEHIGYELGAKMIKDYFDKFQSGGAQFVGRNIIEQILAQPDCIGINVYRGINEFGKEKYVFAGVDSSGNPILEITGVNAEGNIQKIEGLVADRNKDVGWLNINIDL